MSFFSCWIQMTTSFPFAATSEIKAFLGLMFSCSIAFALENTGASSSFVSVEAKFRIPAGIFSSWRD